MRKLQSVFLSTLAFFFAFSLIACSPSDEGKNEQTQTSDEYSQDEQVTQSEPSQEELMAADGWRKGKLRIEIEVTQDGGNKESGVESHWTSVIKAVSEADVMVAEDLRPYVSEGPLPNTDVLQYEPFRYINADADSIQSSEVLYTAFWSTSSDGFKANKKGEYTGKVDRVYLQSLHPSLFGKGYEAYLKINLTGQLKAQEVLSGEGQQPVTTDIDKEVTEEIIYSLHPIPNETELNDYQYLPEGIDEAAKDALVKRNLEMLSLLKEVYKDTQPVQMQIRAGMTSEATEDNLVMTYEYTGNKVVGHAAMMGINSGMANNNLTKIIIQLTATE